MPSRSIALIDHHFDTAHSLRADLDRRTDLIASARQHETAAEDHEAQARNEREIAAEIDARLAEMLSRLEPTEMLVIRGRVPHEAYGLDAAGAVVRYRLVDEFTLAAREPLPEIDEGPGLTVVEPCHHPVTGANGDGRECLRCREPVGSTRAEVILMEGRAR